jgi:hypothetical protein
LGAAPHAVFFSPSLYNASSFSCDPPAVQTWDCQHRLSSLDLQGPWALPTSQTKRYTKILQRGSLLQSLENTAQEKREYGTEKSGPNACRPIKSATVLDNIHLPVIYLKPTFWRLNSVLNRREVPNTA